MVPIGNRARSVCVGRKIRAQPLLLRRARSAAAGDLVAHRVDRDQVPVLPDVEAVVARAALARRPGRVSYAVEIVEVALGRLLAVGARAVLVVSDRRARDRLEAAPTRVIRRLELRE